MIFPSFTFFHNRQDSFLIIAVVMVGTAYSAMRPGKNHTLESSSRRAIMVSSPCER